MNSEQQRIWHDAILQVRHIKDGLGYPVDKEIIETVVIMRLMGIPTVMSCGGHLRRITNGPYVMFEAPKSREYRLKCKHVGDPSSKKFKRYIRIATKLNIQEREKIWFHLDEFYKERLTPYAHRLVMRTTPFSTYLSCQGADLAYLANYRDKRDILRNNRIEMQAFTIYLKDIYFNTLSL